MAKEIGIRKVNASVLNTLNLKTNNKTIIICIAAIANAIGNSTPHLDKFFVDFIIQPSMPKIKNIIKEGMTIKNKPVRAIFHERDNSFLAFLILQHNSLN